MVLYALSSLGGDASGSGFHCKAPFHMPPLRPRLAPLNGSDLLQHPCRRERQETTRKLPRR